MPQTTRGPGRPKKAVQRTQVVRFTPEEIKTIDRLSERMAAIGTPARADLLMWLVREKLKTENCDGK